MNFEFATATRIIFGNGKLQDICHLAPSFGRRALVVIGGDAKRAAPLLNCLAEGGIEVVLFSVSGEPTIEAAREGITSLKHAQAEMVISLGGGSVIDSGKAIAALATNPGDVLDYLEVIGQGKPLVNDPLPFIAIPTTAGTGAEVTKNAVLASEEQQVKVSLRHPAMLPKIALIDPDLTFSMPKEVTASTGMDAITQVLEPFVSNAANPLTDAICMEGLRRGGRAIQRAYENGEDADARTAMAITSLCGGLALANAKLGAVHGFAGVLGGMYPAPHGVICARLLPLVMEANLQAMTSRAPDHPALGKYALAAHLLMGDENATPEDGVAWLGSLSRDLRIPQLGRYGVAESDFAEIVEKSKRASSMKGNPIELTDDELRGVLEKAV
jgi:alcohol dehydrogenase class IV